MSCGFDNESLVGAEFSSARSTQDQELLNDAVLDKGLPRSSRNRVHVRCQVPFVERQDWTTRTRPAARSSEDRAVSCARRCVVRPTPSSAAHRGTSRLRPSVLAPRSSCSCEDRTMQVHHRQRDLLHGNHKISFPDPKTYVTESRVLLQFSFTDPNLRALLPLRTQVL